MGKRGTVWPWISASVLLVAGTIVVTAAFMSGGDQDKAEDPPDAPVVTTTAAAVKVPRVADLMKRAKCWGKVIETQLYTAETGRCTLAGAEVTVATFTTAELRAEWVRNVRDLGGTTHFGDRWAVWSLTRSAASNFAKAVR